MQTTVNTAARRRKVSRSVVKYWPFYIMALPGIVYLIINNYLPLAGLQVAFKGNLGQSLERPAEF